MIRSCHSVSSFIGGLSTDFYTVMLSQYTTFHYKKLHMLQAIIQLILEHAVPKREEVLMLRLTVSPEEYLMINDNIKIVFLGGSKNNLQIMVDAPREVNIVRSAAMENRISNPEERAKLPKFHAVPESSRKYQKPEAK